MPGTAGHRSGRTHLEARWRRRGTRTRHRLRRVQRHPTRDPPATARPRRTPNARPTALTGQSPSNDWSGSWNGTLHGTITVEGDGWIAYLRLEDPPGLSPITTIGRFDTVEAAQLATDEVWAAR